MSKKIVTASIFSLCICSAHAQAELLVGAQYIGQFFAASAQKEQRAQKEAERIALAEAGKLKNEEARAISALNRIASDRAKKEATAEKNARYEALKEKFKEDEFQLELAHVRAVNKIGKNSAALAEENVIYQHKRQNLSDTYNKERNLANVQAQKDSNDLASKYRAEGMDEINRRYRPAAESKDVTLPTKDSTMTVN